MRATVTAFVSMVCSDPQRGRATLVEALGSEALVKRRIERMHWFADQLAEVASRDRKLRKQERRQLQTATLIAAGGLIETLIAWLQGGLDSTPAQLIDDYTHATVAALGSGQARTTR